MGTFQTLRDSIYTVVNTALVGSGKPCIAVYKAHNTAPAGFPYATIGPSEMPSNFDTVSENMRTYSFDLYIWHSIEDASIGEAAALNTVMDAMDLAIDALDADFTLSGAADGVEPVPGEVRVFDGPNGSMVGARVMVRAKVLKSFVA